MGTSNSPQQLARKLDRLAKDLGDPTVALNATALQAKRIMEAAAAGAGVLGTKPADKRKTVGVRYNIKGKGTSTPSAIVGYTGPAHLINNPTRPHRIEPRRRPGVRTRRRGASALTIGGDVRAWANHPGTRGKRFAQQAFPIVALQAPRTFAKAGLTAPVRKAFR